MHALCGWKKTALEHAPELHVICAGGLKQLVRLLKRNGDRLLDDRVDASRHCRHRRGEMLFVVGGDRDGVDRDSVEQRFDVLKDVRYAMLLRELLGAGQIEVADADNLGFIKKLDRLSVNGANPTASDQSKPNLGHRFAYPSRGQSSSKRTRLLRQRARKDFRTALSGVWIVRPPSTVRTAPVTKDASSEAK